MADIKLFSLTSYVTEILSTSVNLEKELQMVIEQNMSAFFGVTFLKSEYPITGGRIDSLGLDENYCPVIFEFKRSTNENVINQGLFYLDWLLDHKADFKLLVMDTLDANTADNIDWSMPQVICVASDFTKFDEHAVNQMQRNIKLVRYKKFGKDLILFEHINAPRVKPILETADFYSSEKSFSSQKTFLQKFEAVESTIQNIYLTIKDYILSLGDDVTENQLKYYVAFKKIKNMACIEIFRGKIVMYLAVDPKSVELIKDFTRDMTNVGHYGTGNLQVIIKSREDFEKVKILIDRAYNEG